MKNNPNSPTLLEQQLAENILVMDGAMGTEIQVLGLKEEDYRGERFRDHHLDLKGNNELLSLTRQRTAFTHTPGGNQKDSSRLLKCWR